MRLNRARLLLLATHFLTLTACTAAAPDDATQAGVPKDAYQREGWFFANEEYSALRSLFVSRNGVDPDTAGLSETDLAVNWSSVFKGVAPEWARPMLGSKLAAVSTRRISFVQFDDWLTAFPVVQSAIRQLVSTQARYLDAPLEIINDQLTARDGEVASGGIELPVGAVSDLSCLRLFRQDPVLGSIAVPAQFHQLGVGHADGSLKWVLVQTAIADTKSVDFPAAQRVGHYVQATPNELITNGLTPNLTPSVLSYRLRSVGRSACTAAAPPAARATAVLSGKSIVIGTGPMTATFSLSTFALPNRMVVDGQTFLSGSQQQLESTRRVIPENIRRCLVDSAIDQPSLIDFGNLNASLNATAGCGSFSASQALLDAAYSSLFGGPMQATIEEAGPVRAVVKFERSTRADASPLQDGDLGYVIRVFASVGSRILRVEYTAINRDPLFVRQRPKSVPGAIPVTRAIRRWELGWAPAIGETATRVRYGFFDGLSAPISQTSDVSSQAMFGADVASRVDVLVPGAKPSTTEPRPTVPDPYNRMGSRTQPWPSSDAAKGYRRGPGANPTGWIEVGGATRSFTFASKSFWQEFPKALSFTPSAPFPLVYHAWPSSAAEPQIIAGGRAKTYEFALGANTDPRQVSAAVRAPLRITPTPAYASRVELDYPFVPDTDARFPSQRGMLRGTYYTMLANLFVGDGDYGDVLGDSASYSTDVPTSARAMALISDTYNLQWNTSSARFNNYRGAALAPLLYGRHSREPHALRVGEAMITHSLDRDIASWAPGEPDQVPGQPLKYWPIGGRELVNGRVKDHLSLAQEPGNIYQWYNDITHYYHQTGSRRVVDLYSQMLAGPWLRFRVGTVGEMTVDRHHTLMAQAMMSIWSVVGHESDANAIAPGAFTGTWSNRSDSCGSPLPSGIGVLGGCSQMQTTALLRRVSETVLSITEGVDWNVRSVDWSGRRSPAPAPGRKRYALGGFITAYAPEMFYRYFSITQSEQARLATLNSANYFYNVMSLPTGGMRYSREPGGAGTYTEAGRTHAYWSRGDYDIATNQMYSPGSAAYLASAGATYVDRSAPVADWLYRYYQRGDTRSALESWAASTLFTARAEGRDESSFAAPIPSPTLETSYEAALIDQERKVTDASTVSTISSGPYGLERDGLDGFAVADSTEPQSGPYQGVGSVRCRLAAETLRGWLNLAAAQTSPTERARLMTAARDFNQRAATQLGLPTVCNQRETPHMIRPLGYLGGCDHREGPVYARLWGQLGYTPPIAATTCP